MVKRGDDRVVSGRGLLLTNGHDVGGWLSRRFMRDAGVVRSSRSSLSLDGRVTTRRRGIFLDAGDVVDSDMTKSNLEVVPGHLSEGNSDSRVHAVVDHISLCLLRGAIVGDPGLAAVVGSVRLVRVEWGRFVRALVGRSILDWPRVLRHWMRR